MRFLDYIVQNLDWSGPTDCGARDASINLLYVHRAHLTKEQFTAAVKFIIHDRDYSFPTKIGDSIVDLSMS